MFAFFINDELKNFWGNKLGDIFAINTITKLKWDQSKVDLVYYPSLDSVPLFKEFGSNKELIIKERIVGHEEITNEDGTVSVVETESFVVKQTIEPVVYVAKGVMVKPC